LTSANLLVQPARLLRRFDVQFYGQDTAARLILRQGFAALAAQGQDRHELPVGFFAHGIEFQLPPGIGIGAVVCLLSLMIRSQLLERP
jgi:hypothetical protein